VSRILKSFWKRLLKINDNKAQNILVNGIDEQTEKLGLLLERLECAKAGDRVMGEGAACFILGAEKNLNTYARLDGVMMLYRPKDVTSIKQSMTELLQKSNLSFDSIDLVLTGNRNRSLEKDFFPTAIVKNYKNLCGEYPTSTAFAMAIAAQLLKGDQLTKVALNINKNEIKHVLIYNNHQNVNHSIILLSKAGN